MIRVQRTVTVQRPREEVATYLSDFRTTQQWDPHTAACTREDSGPISIGSRFVNTQRFGPMRPKYTYEVTDHAPGWHITLRSANRGADLTDTMHFTGDEQSTTVTYLAEVALKGVARVAEPVMRSIMEHLADGAAEGMTRALQALPTSTGRA